MPKFGPLIGAIDEGTSSARFIIFRAGTADVVCYHQENVRRIYPQEGWVEQNPYDLLEVVLTCVEKATQKLIALGGEVKDILAIGIANQRETVIVWDKTTGKPLHNAILWSDMRTSSTVIQLLDNIPNHSRNKNYLKPLCGLPLSPYFSALKLRWLKDNVPLVNHAFTKKSCIFGTVDSWLIWNLTGAQNGGIHITDVSNASRTMLMNIETLQWDKHLLNFFGIPESILPEIKSSSEIYALAKISSLKGIPIAGCLGDQQAALLGQQCISRGNVKTTYGTGCFLLYNTGHTIVNSNQGLLSTVAYQLGKDANPVYALEGSVAVAGSALNWLKDNMNLIDNVNNINQVASSVNDCGDVYFVPAFSGLYAPYWNQDARGVICGLSDDTKQEHIVRACLESVCFQIRDILEAMSKDCGQPVTKLKVDGGMTSNDFLMQLQSDLIGLDVFRPNLAETTALGSAIAAYKAVSEFDLEDFKKLSYTKFKPNITENKRDMRYSKWKMAIERSFGWDSSSYTSENILLP